MLLQHISTFESLKNLIFGWLLCPIEQHGVALPQDEAIGLP
jgi:hypothetical protein